MEHNGLLSLPKRVGWQALVCALTAGCWGLPISRRADEMQRYTLSATVKGQFQMRGSFSIMLNTNRA